ncbi:MAG: hypothetical protein J6D10_06390, partial [Clostridia bacterium]|nr:hypothetical protein [Clostridia bacterium]
SVKSKKQGILRHFLRFYRIFNAILPKGTDCKSAGTAFGGSNPPSPISKKKVARKCDFLFCTLPFSLFILLSSLPQATFFE